MPAADRLGLADALEEAGGPAFIVSHLHEDDPALASCWVVDAILGAPQP